MDLEPGTKTIKLPDNTKIRVLAISVAEENPSVKPAQPLYDVLLPAGPGE
jgi:alpha-mannosidase